MPLFEIRQQVLKAIKRINFNLEKNLQGLIEKNLVEIFNCRFVASEFSTGKSHAGRIDTLALSEENNPVIIEYKKVESSCGPLLRSAIDAEMLDYDNYWDSEVGGVKEAGGRG